MCYTTICYDLKCAANKFYLLLHKLDTNYIQIIKTISFIASFAINFFAIIHHFNLFTGMSKECCAINLHIFSHKSIWSYGVFLLWHANIELMGVTKENNLSLPIHKHLEWLVCTLLRQTADFRLHDKHFIHHLKTKSCTVGS